MTENEKINQPLLLPGKYVGRTKLDDLICRGELVQNRHLLTDDLLLKPSPTDPTISVLSSLFWKTVVTPKELDIAACIEADRLARLVRQTGAAGACTLLDLAFWGHLNIVPFTAEDLKLRRGTSDYSLVHMLAHSGTLGLFSLSVLEPYLDQVDKQGRTICHWASYGGHLDKLPVEYLTVDKFWTRTNEGTKPVHSAAHNGKLHEFFKQLPAALTLREHICATEFNGNNYAHIACEKKLEALDPAWPFLKEVLNEQVRGNNPLHLAFSQLDEAAINLVPREVFTRKNLGMFNNHKRTPFLNNSLTLNEVRGLLSTYYFSIEDICKLRLNTIFETTTKLTVPATKLDISLKDLSIQGIQQVLFDLDPDNERSPAACKDESRRVWFGTQTERFNTLLQKSPADIVRTLGTQGLKDLMERTLRGEHGQLTMRLISKLVPCTGLNPFISRLYTAGNLDLTKLEIKSSLSLIHLMRQIREKLQQLSDNSPKSFNGCVLEYCQPWVQWDLLHPGVAGDLHPLIKLHSPQGFKAAAFEPLFRAAIGELKASQHSLQAAVGVAFRLAVVYGSLAEARKAAAASKLDVNCCPLFELASFSLPQTGRWRITEWRKLLAGRTYLEQRRCVTRAPQVEKRLGRPPKNLEELAHTLDLLDSRRLRNSTDPLDLLANRYALTEAKVQDYRELLKQVKKTEHCPNIEFTDEGLAFRRLKPEDPLGPMLGYTTTCCQILHCNGEIYARTGVTDPDAAFYAVLDSEGDVVAHSFAWRTKDTLVFDSWEHKPEGRDVGERMIKLAAEKALGLDKTLKAVHLGAGGVTPPMALPLTKPVCWKQPWKLKFGRPTDSTMQYLVKSRHPEQNYTAQQFLEDKADLHAQLQAGRIPTEDRLWSPGLLFDGSQPELPFAQLLLNIAQASEDEYLRSDAHERLKRIELNWLEVEDHTKRACWKSAASIAGSLTRMPLEWFDVEERYLSREMVKAAVARGMTRDEMNYLAPVLGYALTTGADNGVALLYYMPVNRLKLTKQEIRAKVLETLHACSWQLVITNGYIPYIPFNVLYPHMGMDPAWLLKVAEAGKLSELEPGVAAEAIRNLKLGDDTALPDLRTFSEFLQLAHQHNDSVAVQSVLDLPAWSTKDAQGNTALYKAVKYGAAKPAGLAELPFHAFFLTNAQGEETIKVIIENNSLQEYTQLVTPKALMSTCKICHAKSTILLRAMETLKLAQLTEHQIREAFEYAKVHEPDNLMELLRETARLNRWKCWPAGLITRELLEDYGGRCALAAQLENCGFSRLPAVSRKMYRLAFENAYCWMKLPPVQHIPKLWQGKLLDALARYDSDETCRSVSWHDVCLDANPELLYHRIRPHARPEHGSLLHYLFALGAWSGLPSYVALANYQTLNARGETPLQVALRSGNYLDGLLPSFKAAFCSFAGRQNYLHWAELAVC